MGGTGSGTGDLVLEWLDVEFGRNFNISYEVIASPNELKQEPIYSVNALLTAHSRLEHSSMTIFVDNAALKRVC